jgi:hypothetical protein
MFPLHVLKLKEEAYVGKLKHSGLCSDNNERTEQCVGMSEMLKCMYETIKKCTEGNYTY